MRLNRRAFLQHSLAVSTVTLGLGSGCWREVFAAPAVIGSSPYGPLGVANALGIRLPAGFSARLIGETGETVTRSRYAWHGAPDGGATFATRDGGWIYVSNSELGEQGGGVGAVRFAANGDITDAYRILSGTTLNCSGGPTPWQTWLSCEEYPQGLVWECDPFAPGQGVARPAMGTFEHEAAAVNPGSGVVYLTEDNNEGRLYRFRPSTKGDLSDGALEAAGVDDGGNVRWVAVSPKQPYRGNDTTAFRRGEGAWFADGVLYFSTTADHRVWSLDTATDRLELLYDAQALGDEAPLHDPDNLTMHGPSGDIYVADDGPNLALVLLANRLGHRIAAPFLQVSGRGGITGPAFNPDGNRLYFSVQRGSAGGAHEPGTTYEVRGPFRRL